MSHAGTVGVYLLAHPDSAGEFVHSCAVEAQFTPGALLAWRYTLRGDMTRLAVPQPGAGRRVDGLWRHTCFEAFVGATDTAGYYEFNFSPALDWAAYRFTGYRTGMTAVTLERAPELQLRRSSEGLELAATVHLAGITALCDARALRVGLAAVIEENDGRLAYWALRHPPGNPDFHHPEGFTLELRPA